MYMLYSIFFYHGPLYMDIARFHYLPNCFGKKKSDKKHNEMGHLDDYPWSWVKIWYNIANYRTSAMEC